ncbi:MAG: hypothetical protein ACR2PO_12295 [Methyloligellaceae bacterium]
MTDASSEPEAARFVQPLPAKPNLEKQKKRAKSLMRNYCRGNGDAVARVKALHPSPPAAGDFALSDAQLVIARGYGFASWPKLKRKIDALTKSPTDLFVDVVNAGDVAAVRQLLESHAELSTHINDPLFVFGRTAAHVAHDKLDLLDLLIARGADITRKSDWEHGGFGVLEEASPEQADALIARGAVVDVWAAAHLGRLETLRDLVEADPALVNAKGGDGKRPLHYARTVEIAAFLLDRGAEIDAKDDDHDSTPAQYLIGDQPKVCGFLIEQGARSDLLMAAALGDVELVRRYLDEDPQSIGMRVSQEWFPMIDTAENGGHIYQWTLGFHVSAFDVARKFGHGAVLDLLQARGDRRARFLDALWTGDLESADALLGEQPNLVRGADDDTWRHVADAARNNDTATVRAMLVRGFPVTATSQHGAMPLHWAAYHGNPEMMRDVLDHDPPLEAHCRDYDGPPLGWALHGAVDPWPGISTGCHADCVALLLDAGTRCEETVFPTGHEGIDAVLRRYLFK